MNNAKPSTASMNDAAQPWELYALKYAHNPNTRARLFLGGVEDDARQDMSFYVWLAKRGAHNVLIDTGYSAATAQRRGRNFQRCPVDSLQLLGVAANQITDVIVTHLHYDHAGNLGKTPNARLHLQSRELQFATSRYMCVKHITLGGVFEPEDVNTIVRENFTGRVNLLDGDAEILPGLSVHRVGGHTPGIQMVRVQTARGPVLLLSDCAHLYENLATQKPFYIVFDLADMMRGWRNGVQMAPSSDHLVPGHDPLVMEVYPPVQGLEGIAVKLHEPPMRSPLPPREELLQSMTVIPA